MKYAPLILCLILASGAHAETFCGTAIEVNIVPNQLPLEMCAVAGTDANGVAWGQEFNRSDSDLGDGSVLSFAAALEPLTFPTTFGVVCEDTLGNPSEYAEPSGECVPPSSPGIVME